MRADVTITQINIHPVKSCAPLSLAQARVEPRGLQHDRRWMVVDAEGRLVTGRELPRLTLLRAQPHSDGLQLDAPGMPTWSVRAPSAVPRQAVTVWKDEVPAFPADAATNAWISRFLDRELRLVHMDATCHRPLQHARTQPGDEVSFADSHPLMLISQASLDGLNARLAQPVPMRRFRPNLVVDGTAAHAEDGWRQLRIGAVRFDVAKACTRCIFTTVDPDRGERSADGEPLKTLKGYRRTDEGVTFGQHLIPRDTGIVRVGDPVQVLA